MLYRLPPEILHKILGIAFPIPCQIRQYEIYELLTLSRDLHPIVLEELLKVCLLHSEADCQSLRDSIDKSRLYKTTQAIRITLPSEPHTSAEISSIIEWFGKRLEGLQDLFCFAPGGTLPVPESSNVHQLALAGHYKIFTSLQISQHALLLPSSLTILCLSQIRLDLSTLTLWLEAMGSLETLSIGDIVLYTNEGTSPSNEQRTRFHSALVTRCSQLEKLSVREHLTREWENGSKVSICALLFPHVSNLKILHFEGRDIDHLVDHIDTFDSLRRLVIFGLTYVGRPTFIPFFEPNFPSLQSVAIETMPEDSYWIDMLEELEERDVEYCDFDDVDRFEQEQFKWDEWFSPY